MSPFFIPILKIAAVCDVEHVNFFTNGLLLDTEKMNAIVEHGVTQVCVSVDGATPDTYNSIRRGGVRVPGIACWKGMIAPGRTSDGLFDLMDLFGVGLNLAGASTDKLPADKYFDFIDQTSFLLADDGQSKREAVYFWWGKELMACRMKEYKVHVKVILAEAPHMHIDFATIRDVGLAPWFFNRYRDPKEEGALRHR